MGPGRMVPLGIDREPAGLRFPRQGCKLGIMFQRRFSGIGDEAAIGPDGQDLVKGLVRRDLTGLPRLARIGSVNVDHHAAKGDVAVTNDLAEAEFRDSFLGHEGTVNDPT